MIHSTLHHARSAYARLFKCICARKNLAHSTFLIRCGTLAYMSPRVFARNVKYDGRLADVWSLGVILFIIATGAPPFATPDRSDPRFMYIYSGKLVDLLRHWGMLDNIHPSLVVNDTPIHFLKHEHISVHL